MFKILQMNPISELGLKELPKDTFTLAVPTKGDADPLQTEKPDAVLVRSASMLAMPANPNLLAVARAGAGYNNIPVEEYTKQGIAVFNTPGANANAVKELVLASLFMAARNIVPAIAWTQELKGTKGVAEAVEKGKKAFVGEELYGKTIGIFGLGAIGGMVANACEALGMNVIGHDPSISVEAAWALSKNVKRAATPEEVLKESDFVSIHLPLINATRGMFNEKLLSKAKKGAYMINAARGEIVDTQAMADALKNGKIKGYVCDFPTDETIGIEGITFTPHLGASTNEAEDNCAVMAVRQVKDYLVKGALKNAVNLPDCPVNGLAEGDTRITIVNKDIPNVLSSVLDVLTATHKNISGMMNKAKGVHAYTAIDITGTPDNADLAKIQKVEGVIRTRVIRSAGDER